MSFAMSKSWGVWYQHQWGTGQDLIIQRSTTLGTSLTECSDPASHVNKRADMARYRLTARGVNCPSYLFQLETGKVADR